MKAKTLLTKGYIPIILLFSGCSLFDCDDPDPDPDPIYTYQQAVSTINSFKSNLLESANSNAVVLQSFHSARAGEVWIYHECKSSIQNYSASLLDRYSGNDYSLLIDSLPNKIYEFHWKNSWTDQHSIELDIGYELLEAVIKAAKEESEIKTIDFKFSLKDPQYIRVKNIGDLRNEYENDLDLEGRKAEGNIIISALITGKMHVEYKAMNEQNQKIDVDLSVKLNELLKNLLLKPDYKYFNEQGSSGDFSIIEESDQNSIVFAIEYFKIPFELQDQADINEKVNEYCDGDETLVRVKDVKGYCLTREENIIDLRIEAGASADELFFFWTNLIDEPITLFFYTLIIRNRNGQILKSYDNRFVSQTINPGITLQSGSIHTSLPGFMNFQLQDVEFELDIVEAKNGFDIICN